MGKDPAGDPEQLQNNLRVKPDVYLAALMDEVNEHLIELIDKIGSNKNTQNPFITKLYTSPETAIAVATLIQPDSADVIANPTTIPPTPGYQTHTIYETLKRLSPKIAVINDGTDILYVISSSDGLTWSPEITILPGEYWDFVDVWELRLRSPTVGDAVAFTGGVYRISEYKFGLAYSGLQPSASGALGGPAFPIGNTNLTNIIVQILGTPMNAVLDTTTPLGPNATYFGAIRDFRNSRLGFMGVLAASDVISAANGFRIQQSNETVIWVDEDAIITTAVPGGFAGRIKSAIATRFARVAYTNGVAAQSTFSLGSRATIA
ncbi:MAG: hypothetical protein PHZ02_01610 [Desulfocapsaceae bacterium]|nr:hypothetical protein [Desulfocapsaceae bacterium]